MLLKSKKKKTSQKTGMILFTPGFVYLYGAV